MLEYDILDAPGQVGGVLSRLAYSPPSQVYFQQIDAFDGMVPEELAQGVSGNSAQRLIAWTVRGDHTLGFVAGINIHHCIAAIGSVLFTGAMRSS